jgi:hypothetical protein
VRGRIIFPFVAELARLDPTATPYDAEFEEPQPPGARGELPLVRVRCQVESAEYEAVRLAAAGNVPRSRLTLVFHFRDLERQGLVDPSTSDALLLPGDRLAGLYDVLGHLVQAVRTPPGLYLVEARPVGFGLLRRRPRRNLLLSTFHDRPQGLRRSS